MREHGRQKNEASPQTNQCRRQTEAPTSWQKELNATKLHLISKREETQHRKSSRGNKEHDVDEYAGVPKGGGLSHSGQS